MQVDHRLIGDLHHPILNGLDPQEQGAHRRPLPYAISLGLDSLPSLTINVVAIISPGVTDERDLGVPTLPATNPPEKESTDEKSSAKDEKSS